MQIDINETLAGAMAEQEAAEKETREAWDAWEEKRQAKTIDATPILEAMAEQIKAEKEEALKADIEESKEQAEQEARARHSRQNPIIENGFIELVRGLDNGRQQN